MPFACLLNHSAAAPHVRQYGRLRSGFLHFPASHAVAAGQQVFLHYGPHDNAHLLAFYGFIIPGNPNDSVMLSFKVNCSRAALPDDPR